MTSIQYVLFAFWGISLVLMSTFILLHSGKGSAFSDGVATNLYASKGASAIMEKNLNRMTNVCIVMFVASVVLCLVFFPVGTFGL